MKNIDFHFLGPKRQKIRSQPNSPRRFVRRLPHTNKISLNQTFTEGNDTIPQRLGTSNPYQQAFQQKTFNFINYFQPRKQTLSYTKKFKKIRAKFSSILQLQKTQEIFSANRKTPTAFFQLSPLNSQGKVISLPSKPKLPSLKCEDYRAKKYSKCVNKIEQSQENSSFNILSITQCRWNARSKSEQSENQPRKQNQKIKTRLKPKGKLDTQDDTQQEVSKKYHKARYSKYNQQ